MDRRHWLERVDDELAGAGLTAGVRGRLMEELRDHLEDLSEGRGDMATETEVVQWMGDPVELAAAVVAESRQVSWVRRHSLLVFGLAPVPTISMGVALYVSLLVALGYFATAIGYNEHSFPRAVATAFTYGVAFVPFLVVAIAFGFLGARAHARRWWLAAALTQVAVLGGLITVQLNWSDLQGQSQLIVGVGLPFSASRQIAQFLLPLVVGWFVVRASRRVSALV
jgi:uncharacterized membrane protein